MNVHMKCMNPLPHIVHLYSFSPAWCAGVSAAQRLKQKPRCSQSTDTFLSSGSSYVHCHALERPLACVTSLVLIHVCFALENFATVHTKLCFLLPVTWLMGCQTGNRIKKNDLKK